MTQEEKDLLLKDLCGRLPYGVKIRIEYPFLNKKEWHSEILYGLDLQRLCIANTSIRIEEFKPYLFPLSSMTKEQKEEYNSECNKELKVLADSVANRTYTKTRIAIPLYYATDWLNANHFDYRGLIEKSLA